MTFERPPAEPAKLTEAWHAWTAGDELPGRTMADLKIGGLDLVLEALVDDKEVDEDLLAPWVTWRRAVSPPRTRLTRSPRRDLAI